MNGFDERHAGPPTIGPSAGRRVRGRPRLTSSSLTRRRPHGSDAASAQERGDPRGPASLAEWHAMSEPEYVLAWEQLREWTVWLIGRYRLVLEDRLPGCWPQHPELIEELWALRAWRAEAYGPDGTGQSAVYWHQALVAFLGHVSAWWAGGCRAGHSSATTDLTSEQTGAWTHANPLAGIPQSLRPAALYLNVLTDAQMRALTDVGLARPQHEHVTAFTFYDGSWWAFASPETDEEQALWFRADDADLPDDPSFTQIPGDNR